MHFIIISAMQNLVLINLVSVGGVTSLTLTFFHPAFWVPVACFVGFAVLILATMALSESHTEPPALHFALLWIAATLILAILNGISAQLYNSLQISFLVFGLVLGYLVSVARTSTWVAWTPFAVFAAYFLTNMLLGRDPSEALTRNSQNFISVIMLALYASAILLSKPTRVDRLHLLMAFLILFIAVWSTGRGGIAAALVLNLGLLLNIILRGEKGVVRALVATATVLISAVIIYFGTSFLLTHGYLGRLAERGLTDAPRLAMIAAYFQNIEPMELFLGRNYYDDSFLARWDFNLHNSYLSAWAHLGLFYLLFILGTLGFLVLRIREFPAIAISMGAFGLRAFTDIQLISGKYDYMFFAALFIGLRGNGALYAFKGALASSRLRGLHKSAR